ncbi:MAG TPA: glycosyltransferase family 4 protein [Terriglobia bacterium]|nr:glycosyltransferase family 4 protein [Terriglobia bacterium]
MPRDRFRVLLVASHPVQYASPVFRRMAQDPRLDIQVAYCSLQGTKPAVDPEFGVEVAWDVPLLEGYPWVEVQNRSPWPGLGRFWGLVNPGLWRLLRKGSFDAVVSYTGYGYLSFWILAAAAKFSRTPLLSSTDAHSLSSPNTRRWKLWVKRLCLPLIYRVCDVVMAPSEATARFVRSLGFPAENIVLTPAAVDNDWWAREADQIDKCAVHRRWGIPENSRVFLFCSKLQPWKRPEDALRAFAKLGNPEAFLVFAGDGPLRPKLEAEAKALAVASRTVFLGFVNQTRLPELFRSSDVLLLTSSYDGCPLVVCEAMACGCPVILSDAIPGRFDIVRQGTTGFIYPCGDVDALASVLREVLSNPQELQQIAAGARKRMETWSPRENIDALVLAFETAVRLKPRRAQL